MAHGCCGAQQVVDRENFRWHMYFILEGSVLQDSIFSLNALNPKYPTCRKDSNEESQAPKDNNKESEDGIKSKSLWML